MKKATLKDIAEKSGVSASTVSRIINNSAGVNEEKRERVKAVLKQIAQKPKVKLASKAKNVGVLILSGPEFDHRGILKKIDFMSKNLPPKWNLFILSSDISSYDLEARCLRGDISGIIIFGYGSEREDLRETLKHIPHVWMNSHKNNKDESSVLMGNELAGRLAARYLIQSKCKKTAVLTAESLNPGFAARIEGFRFEFFTNKMTCDEMRLSAGEQSQAIEICGDDYMDVAIENMLSENKLEQYDGIFSPEERLTPFLHRGLLRIRQKKWPVIISCNHTPEYLAGLYPRPASIDLGPQMLAELALNELFRRISGKEERKDNLAVITTPTIVYGDPV